MPQTKQHTILIAGCGDVGSTLGQLLLKQGEKVLGLRRNINQLPQGIQGISADLSQIDSLKVAVSGVQHCDVLVYSAAATNHSEEGYQAAYIDGLANLLNALPCRPNYIFFTSSTGVYHQADQSLIDENSPCEPKRFSGKLMLKAEEAVIHGEIPGTVVRFSGIYGPGRNHLINKVKSGEIAPAEPMLYTNRIHRDDCAGVLNHLITQQLNGVQVDNCYLASDNEPAPLHDVTIWLSEQLNVNVTKESVTRMTGSKRCNNSRLQQSGYTFKYPSYQEGYKALLKAE